MPYKDSERKRQWERDHREQRNARRRMQHLAGRSRPIVTNATPDPISRQEPRSTWKIVAGIGAFGLAVALGVLAVLGGASTTLGSGPGRSST
jgi:ferric-dicitrate binding protein FerR (iron transport regulator)